MLKILTGFIAGAILAGTGMAVAAPNNPENAPRWMSNTCGAEDSRNCFWDATIKGDGEGFSFYSIRINKKLECKVYWHNWYAKTHNYCTKP